jgi:flagellar basal body-associated protein FliL
MKKKLIIIIAAIIGILAIGGYFAYQMMMKPMYLPGDLTQKNLSFDLFYTVNFLRPENMLIFNKKN